MHHRRDRIPVWIILFFFDAGRSTHVGFLSVPVIRFPPFQPCVTRARILSPYFSSISTSPPLLSPLAANPWRTSYTVTKQLDQGYPTPGHIVLRFFLRSAIVPLIHQPALRRPAVHRHPRHPFLISNIAR